MAVALLVLQCRERMMTVLEDSSSSSREGAGRAVVAQSDDSDGRGPAGTAQAAGQICTVSSATIGAAAAAAATAGQAGGRVHRDFR
jgi:hypothetical protein